MTMTMPAAATTIVRPARTPGPATLQQTFQQTPDHPGGPQKGHATPLAPGQMPNLIALTCSFLFYQDPKMIRPKGIQQMPANEPANPQLRPPKGLASAGRAKWREATSEFVFDPVESAVLLQFCRLLDHLEGLECESKAQPALSKGSRNQPVLNPILQEIRLQSLALAKLAAALDLPDPKASTPRRKGRLSSVENIARRAH